MHSITELAASSGVVEQQRAIPVAAWHSVAHVVPQQALLGQQPHQQQQQLQQRPLCCESFTFSSNCSNSNSNSNNSIHIHAYSHGNGNSSGRRGSSSEHSPPTPRHRPVKRLRFNQLQLTRLEEAFRASSHPSKKIKEALASELCIPARNIQIWFQNRRQRRKSRHPQDAGGFILRTSSSTTTTTPTTRRTLATPDQSSSEEFQVQIKKDEGIHEEAQISSTSARTTTDTCPSPPSVANPIPIFRPIAVVTPNGAFLASPSQQEDGSQPYQPSVRGIEEAFTQFQQQQQQQQQQQHHHHQYGDHEAPDALQHSEPTACGHIGSPPPPPQQHAAHSCHHPQQQHQQQEQEQEQEQELPVSPSALSMNFEDTTPVLQFMLANGVIPAPQTVGTTITIAATNPNRCSEIAEADSAELAEMHRQANMMYYYQLTVPHQHHEMVTLGSIPSPAPAPAQATEIGDQQVPNLHF